MKMIFTLVSITLILNACATFSPTIPESYHGPTASIVDTEKTIDGGKSELFYLSKINGKQIYNSRIATRNDSYGQGNVLSTITLSHLVLPIEQVFTVEGRTVYAMPARALISTVYEVKGEITFSPEENKNYQIKGTLSEERSKVWIEVIDSGEIVGAIELDGPSKLGFFEK